MLQSWSVWIVFLWFWLCITLQNQKPKKHSFISFSLKTNWKSILERRSTIPKFCLLLQTLITLDDNNVLTQVQQWDGKETTITRKIEDGKLIVVSRIFSDFYAKFVHYKWNVTYLKYHKYPPTLSCFRIICL